MTLVSPRHSPREFPLQPLTFEEKADYSNLNRHLERGGAGRDSEEKAEPESGFYEPQLPGYSYGTPTAVENLSCLGSVLTRAREVFRACDASLRRLSSPCRDRRGKVGACRGGAS